MIEIKISNKIYIKGLKKDQLSTLKKSLTLPNPVYQKMLNRVKYNNQSSRCLYAIKKDYKYYEYDKEENLFVCGRGNEERLIKFFNKGG